MKIQVLDCTLRDGGYYCDWDFDDKMIKKYLSSISTAKIDVVEIGFRFFPQDRFLGPFAYSTDNYLSSLPLPSDVKIAVMVNANDLINHEYGSEVAVNKLFKECSESPVDIVRVATHAGNIDNCQPIAKRLTELGYCVMLNLMQVDTLSEKELLEIARLVKTWESVDVLYFADSFGNMDPESIYDTIKILSKIWKRPIGLHTHDNKGQALSNCIAAVKGGVTYLDGTLLGMGRGAGNVKTENLVVELTQRGYGEYFPDAIFPLVLHEFKELKEYYDWGTNIYYFLSAVHGIHPTYIQEMLNDERYSTEHILSSINFLKSTSAPFYSLENMLRSFSGVTGTEHGEWSAANWANGRDILILGAGAGTKRYINALQQYVMKKKPVVLCLNINEAVPNDIVDAYVACHESRILIELDHYSDLLKPLILPLSRVPEDIRNALNNVDIFDYGLRTQEGCYQITSNGCVLSRPLAIAYAMALATASGANKILLAGMDGYEISDPRQTEMIELLEKYSGIKHALPIIAITPTTYPVEKHSVYELDI